MNIGQHSGLQSPATPFISAFLLALILPLHRCAVLPSSFHSSMLLLKPADHSSVSICPIMLFTCVWMKWGEQSQKDLPPAAESKLSVGPLLSHLKEDASKCQWYPNYLKGWKDLEQEKWIQKRVLQRQEEVWASSSLSWSCLLPQVACKESECGIYQYMTVGLR